MLTTLKRCNDMTNSEDSNRLHVYKHAKNVLLKDNDNFVNVSIGEQLGEIWVK